MVFVLLIFEEREESNDGRTRTQLCKTWKEDRRVDHDARQTNLLLGEIGGHHKKRSQKSDGDSYIIHQRSPDTLFDNNAHNVLYFQ